MVKWKEEERIFGPDATLPRGGSCITNGLLKMESYRFMRIEDCIEQNAS